VKPRELGAAGQADSLVFSIGLWWATPSAFLPSKPGPQKPPLASTTRAGYSILPMPSFICPRFFFLLWLRCCCSRRRVASGWLAHLALCRVHRPCSLWSDSFYHCYVCLLLWSQNAAVWSSRFGQRQPPNFETSKLTHS
jgi:hypothetical protein